MGKASHLRSIPSVERVLQTIGSFDLPRPTLVGVVRRELTALRKQGDIPGFEIILARIRTELEKVRSARIQPLINGTGILVHTNLGRAPLGPAVIETLCAIGSNYNNLEYDLSSGERGTRASYLEHNLALLCSAQAATVVNNCAAALVLILRHFTSRKPEVIISRGELIQIGGGFRIPEILEASGARLREVGTTNKTSLSDYAKVINSETGLILKVHRSNFFIGGFAESPPTEEIAALARKKRVPFVEDLGSGAVLATETMAGLEHEPTAAEVLRRGVDLVCFSGDKLLGGPQAGIIAGRTRLITELKREPFFRALRCDKLVLSALQTTVDIYLESSARRSERGGGSSRSEAARQIPGRAGVSNGARIPVLAMLQVSNDELRARAKQIVSALGELPCKTRVGEGKAQIGGGTLPRSVIPSVTVELIPLNLALPEFAARLRSGAPPVIGYISSSWFKLDVRTIFPRQDEELVRVIRMSLRFLTADYTDKHG